MKKFINEKPITSLLITIMICSTIITVVETMSRAKYYVPDINLMIIKDVKDNLEKSSN